MRMACQGDSAVNKRLLFISELWTDIVRRLPILYLRIDYFRGTDIQKQQNVPSFISEYQTRKAEIHTTGTYLRHLRYLWKIKEFPSPERPYPTGPSELRPHPPAPSP